MLNGKIIDANVQKRIFKSIVVRQSPPENLQSKEITSYSLPEYFQYYQQTIDMFSANLRQD
jgi:hypothetical protein